MGGRESGGIVQLVVKQSGQIPVVSMIPAWAWRCEVCGWVGQCLVSERAAGKEGSAHVWEEHGIALCDPDVLDGGNTLAGMHDWRHVPGSDSLDECKRCGRYCGK